MTTAPATPNALAPTPPAQPPATTAPRLLATDDSAFSNLLDTARFEHMWRVAQMYAKSQIIPEHFRGKPEDCFIGIQMAVRLGVDPFMFLQNTYVVYGRPGMEAKLAIALINSSGLFVDGLSYEIEGDEPVSENYRVRAVAIRKSTGTIIKGPWIDWGLVRKEGWDKKQGSKWMTMPGQMFCYRAATFFGRLYCPERLMGMQTADELEDVGDARRYVENMAPPPQDAAHIAAEVQRQVRQDEQSTTTSIKDEPKVRTPEQEARTQQLKDAAAKEAKAEPAKPQEPAGENLPGMDPKPQGRKR